MRGSRWWALLGALMLALAVACGSDSKEEGSGRESGTGPAGGQTGGAATQAAAQIKRGGTLNLVLGNNPKTFDPMLANDVASANITSNVFEGLYKFDEQLKPVPWLAEKADVNQDSTEYTFYLRRGVKFHDGTEMNAEAVKFSMERVKNNRASVRASDLKTVTEIAVLDTYTVRVTHSEPNSPWPAKLTLGAGAVVSPTAVRTLGDEKFGLSPVGTGPFKFGEWRNDVSVTVVKNPDYWRPGADGQPLPYLDRLDFKIITEAANRLTAIQAGDVDIFAGNTNPRDVDLPIIKKDPSLIVQDGPGFGWSGLWLTISKPPFDNKALRQAVQYAIDREEIVRAIYENTRTIANGPIPPTITWAVDKEYKPYPTKADPEKAKAKLAEGGKPNGFEFEFLISAGDQITQQFAELVQSQLAKVNIKMNIKAADFNGVVIPALMKGESNAYALGLTGGVDPDQHVANGFETGAGFNYFPYSNPQVDALLRQGRTISDLEQRAKLYKDAVRLLMEDSPYIFTHYAVDRVTTRRTVHGWYLGSKATSGYSEFWKD